MEFTSWDAGLHSKDKEYLQHYGVVGMKWHMHKYGNNYQYQSHATKKYSRKATKAMAKGHVEKARKFMNRAKRSAEIDRGEQEYAKGISTGKALAGTLLFGGDRMKGYAQYRAMSGQSGKKMTGHKVVSGMLAGVYGAAGSRQRKAAYIRQDEGKKGLGQKAYNLNRKIGDRAAAATQQAIDLVNNARKKKHRS